MQQRAELTTLALLRNENSGSLSGLTRVRRFHQDDGHIFCRPIQIAQEISATLQFIETAYRVFHLPTPELVLSTRPDNYIGDLEEWDRAEAALKQVLDASGQPWTVNEGDGAFYGPKIDIMIEDSDGKKHQTATVQLDFQLPRRFGLEYTAPAPASEQKGIISEDPVELSEHGSVTPVIIHRAVMGSLERFMALLIEHYNGRWPFWLSPRQAIVIPVAMTDEIVSYAQAAQETISGVVEKDKNQPVSMSRRTFHVDIDLSTKSLSKKIRAAKTSKYNHIIVVGEKNVKAGTVSVDAATVPSYVKAVEGAPAAAVRTKPVEMTPAEMYKHFVELEDRYA
jgi:threonyl-tRNA synthetase